MADPEAIPPGRWRSLGRRCLGPPGRRLRRAAAVAAALLLATVAALLLSLRGQLSLVAFPATPLFEDRQGRYLAEAGQEWKGKGFWEVGDPLPERVVACLLAIEDKRFAFHSGIDGRALLRSVWHTLSGRGREGASTIAMQVARLQHPGRRTLWKKLREMATARILVARYGRREVLRQYLKIVPQGNQIFGVAYAARRYFQKPLADLSWAEASLLAAIAKAPGRMNLFSDRGLARARTRARLILSLLVRQRRITREEWSAQTAILETLDPPRPETRPLHSTHAILRLGEELGRKPFSRILRPVRASLDMDLQLYLDQLAMRTMNACRPNGAGNMAAMVVDRSSGKIRGYLGSEFYFSSEYAGAINYARTPRSSGSTLKPFLFALGLQDGKFTPASVIPDLPLAITHESGDYSITNFDDSYLGPLLYRRALANSRNVPAVKVLKTVGLTRAYDLFCRLGLASPAQRPSHYGLNLAVGGLYVTLENLVQAYLALANEGRMVSLDWFEEDPEPPAPTPAVRVFPAAVARQVTLFLADPQARLPSFARRSDLEYNFPVAVKTGTSQGFRDAWAVAYSSRYLVGVWIGHAANDPMKEISGLTAAGVVKRILLHLHPGENRGLNESPFPVPGGYASLRLCPVSGQLAGDLCPEATLEYFRPGQQPAGVCSVHRRLAVDRRSGRPAEAGTPRRFREMKSVLLLPPEYAVWASHKGVGRPPRAETDVQATALSISYPLSGSRFRIDPDTPVDYQTMPLRALVAPLVPAIDWYVDGRRLASVGYPYEARWPIAAGEHVIEARFPHAFIRSRPVRISVR